MSNINFGQTLSFNECVNLIALCPEIRVHVEGEPGIGKSSMLEAIARKAGIDSWAYIDTPNLDIGDAAMPVIKHDTKTTGFYPNERFKLHEGKPVVIMLDEFSKGMQAVQNMLHPLLEEKNPRFGDIPLPEGSIVFTTGNLGSDGVGDGRKAHTIGRQTTVRMRKPTAEEWINNYAVNAGVAAPIIAWVERNPQVLASYLDSGQEDNHYIYNPRRPGKAYCAPRSLSRASHIVKQRRELGENAMVAALTGTIGEKGAHDLGAYIAFQNEIPAWKEIIENPKTANVPASSGATSVLIFGAVMRVESDNIDAFMEYLDRFDTNWQATFCLTLAKSAKQKVGFRNAKYTKWLADNQDLL
jgi:hypothetical protein